MSVAGKPGRFKCLVCGGVYSDPQPDGRRYFHACGDLTPVVALPGHILNAKVTLHGLERRPGKRIDAEPRKIRRAESPLDKTTLDDRVQA